MTWSLVLSKQALQNLLVILLRFSPAAGTSSSFPLVSSWSLVDSFLASSFLFRVAAPVLCDFMGGMARLLVKAVVFRYKKVYWFCNRVEVHLSKYTTEI